MISSALMYSNYTPFKTDSHANELHFTHLIIDAYIYCLLFLFQKHFSGWRNIPLKYQG